MTGEVVPMTGEVVPTSGEVVPMTGKVVQTTGKYLSTDNIGLEKIYRSIISVSFIDNIDTDISIFLSIYRIGPVSSIDPIFSSLFFPLYFYKMVRLFPFFHPIFFHPSIKNNPFRLI